MIKKIAESVKQPLSYNRISRILSSVGGKISVPTVGNYVQYCQDAWLLLRMHNIASPFVEKETISKYYFTDNGILNLFLIDADTSLLENLVAVTLLRKYGNDPDNERVFYYNSGVEVDFFVPDEGLAIQVCYNLSHSDGTYEREVSALKKLPSALECKRRLIITYDDEATIEDNKGKIEVLPYWKWSLS